MIFSFKNLKRKPKITPFECELKCVPIVPIIGVSEKLRVNGFFFFSTNNIINHNSQLMFFLTIRKVFNLYKHVVEYLTNRRGS